MRTFYTIFTMVILFIHCSSAQTANNLGPAINSSYAELNPIIANGGKRLYFVVSDHPSNYKAGTGRFTQDIWYSDKDSNGVWSERKPMPYPVNSYLINSVEATDPSGKILILKGAFTDGKYVGRGYSYTYLSKQGWTSPQSITIGNYTNMDKGVFSGLTITPDMKAVILSFSEDSASSNQDLYIALRIGRTTLSTPIPLRILNTTADESTPYIAADGRTLYFTSNRKGAMGIRDIYMSRRIGNGWDKWTTPVNLGPSINTEDSESYFTIDPETQMAYYVSTNNSMGKEDIVQIALEPSMRPQATYVLRGIMKDGITGNPLGGEVIYHDLVTGAENGRVLSDETTGEYVVYLEKDLTYGIEATAPGYIGLSYYIDEGTFGNAKTRNVTLYLFPIQAGTSIPLTNVFFATGKSTLLPSSTPQLNRLVTILKEYPTMTLQINGHTDNTGSAALNTTLSKQRAAEVKKYLTQKGFDAGRFSTTGYGSSKPIADNTTANGRQQNRRVEIVILKVDR
ncbi:MAG: OmpA family protein [Cytophagaceae bacterium]|jgi:outer membrane protein OmpA-like peptidoglycan-associated protein|nr:OmpA family protein [Cytophagaceae bacterium]